MQQVKLDQEGNIVEPSQPLTGLTLQELKDSTRKVKQMLELPNPVGKRQLDNNTLRPVYIAANTTSLGNSFAIGDGQLYGEYQNYELQPDSSYYVAVAILIENQQVTSSLKLL